MLFNKIKNLQNPDKFQGINKSKNYFEGWYFKLIDATEKYALAIIPGISMSPQGEKNAFIQILDGKECKTAYIAFDSNLFEPNKEHFSVRIKDNEFSDKSITLNLDNLKGTINFKNTQPIKKTILSPGIMGWYSYVPFMECYHGIVSMNHRLEGILEIEGKSIDFTGGKGYIEKDWGKSFPNSWIWMQTNHFEYHEASLMASVAKIPWLGNHFIGFLISFWIEGTFYRFATYTGAKMKSAKVNDDKVELYFKNKPFELYITAVKGATGELVSPIQGNMAGKVNESLDAKIHVRLLKNGQLVFDDWGRNAGLEVAGEYHELLT
ncbi:MAG: tocopherol cyclase family protein [Saprospiraceae bacterium]